MLKLCSAIPCNVIIACLSFISITTSFLFQPTGISEEVFRQIETVQNRYDSSTAEAFRAVQKSGEMVVRTLDPRQFIRLASETAQKINIDTNVSNPMFFLLFSVIQCLMVTIANHLWSMSIKFNAIFSILNSTFLSLKMLLVWAF